MNAENILLVLSLSLLSAHLHLTDVSNDNIRRWERKQHKQSADNWGSTFKDGERESERDRLSGQLQAVC